MSVILGNKAAIELNLGAGGQCVLDVFTWRLNLERESLETTKQGDTARTRTGGLADATGSFGCRVRLLEDGGQATSPYQLINHILSNEDDDLLAAARFIIQIAGEPNNCNKYGELILDGVWLEGDILITTASINCSEPAEPIVIDFDFEASGPMILNRGTLVA